VGWGSVQAQIMVLDNLGGELPPFQRTSDRCSETLGAEFCVQEMATISIFSMG
jgi:hypothetical protein